MTSKDFLDEIIEGGTDRNPRFAAMVDAAYERRRRLRTPTEKGKQSETAEVSSDRHETENG